MKVVGAKEDRVFAVVEGADAKVETVAHGNHRGGGHTVNAFGGVGQGIKGSVPFFCPEKVW